MMMTLSQHMMMMCLDASAVCNASMLLLHSARGDGDPVEWQLRVA
jgi:hypothetical protein